MTRGSTCTCFNCIVEGPERCSTKCVLRYGHAGPHMGWFAFLRLVGRTVRRLVGERISGRRSA